MRRAERRDKRRRQDKAPGRYWSPSADLPAPLLEPAASSLLGGVFGAPAGGAQARFPCIAPPSLHLLFFSRDNNKWRWRVWTPALRAAGIEHRRIYDCRHTFASWGIAGGVQLFYLARIMGTSVAQIDATYGHLLPDSEDYLRGLLDEFDTKSDERGEAHG
jgi:integrase